MEPEEDKGIVLSNSSYLDLLGFGEGTLIVSASAPVTAAATARSSVALTPRSAESPLLAPTMATGTGGQDANNTSS